MDASARVNAMRFNGGEAIARVAWSPRSPRPGTPENPLAALREAYADRGDDAAPGTPGDVESRARRALAAVRATAAHAATSPAPSRSTPGCFAPVAALKAATQTVALSPKERMGKMGELRYEADAANRRAKKTERELRNASARFKSSRRSARRSRGSEARWRRPNESRGSRREPSYAPGGPSSRRRRRERRALGLSTSPRWARWEMDAEEGWRSTGMLLRNYAGVEGEPEGTRPALRRGQAHDFAKDELRATRDALEDLKRSFEAAESLLNEGLEHKDALEDPPARSTRRRLASSRSTAKPAPSATL